jgi:predicted transcriptional regulator
MLIKLVNLSLQGFNIFLVTDSGPKSFWLTPKESVMIPESSVSSQIKKMIKKKILRLERV